MKTGGFWFFNEVVSYTMLVLGNKNVCFEGIANAKEDKSAMQLRTRDIGLFLHIVLFY